MHEGTPGVESQAENPLLRLSEAQRDTLDHELNMEGFDLSSVENMLSYFTGEERANLERAIDRLDAKEIANIIG